MMKHLSTTADTMTTILVYYKKHGIFPKLIMVETRPTTYHKHQYLQNYFKPVKHKPWVSNLFMTQGHTCYYALVHEPHKEK